MPNTHPIHLKNLLIRQFVLCLLVVSLLLTSCTYFIARFAYNNIDWWIIDYTNDYFSLSKQQKEQIETQLDALRPWHKEIMLPRIALLLQRIESYAQQPTITTTDVQTLTVAIAELRNQHVNKLLPFTVHFLQNIHPDQLQHARDYAHTRHQERIEQLQDGEYEKELAEQLEERFVDLFGSITQDQQAQLIKHIQNANQFRKWQLTQWGKNRAWFFALLERGIEKHISANTMENELRMRLEQPEDYFSEPYKSAWYARRQDAYRTVVTVHSMLSEEQKQQFVQAIDDYIAIVDSLMNERL